MSEPTKCGLCGRPVERDSYGRPRRFHPECRRKNRSETMAGNQNAVGHGRPRVLTPFPGTNADELRSEAYANLDVASVRRNAIAYWGEIAELCYHVYDCANDQFYDGRIPTPLFQICRVMPYGKCIGLSHVTDIERPVIDIFASLWNGPSPYAAVGTVVLHEMLHFHNRFVWRDRGEIWYQTSHENELWLDAVKHHNRILRDDTATLMDSPFERWPLFGPTKTKRIDKSLAIGKWPW